MSDDSKRIKVSGKAIPVRGNDIDTDRIIPARFLRCVTFDGIGEHAFEDDRKQVAEKGGQHPFDNPAFAGAEILLANKNFGCGSSREHAPQAIMRWGRGIKAIIGESFAEIFFGNCISLGIPAVTVDAGTVGKIMSAVEADSSIEVSVDVENKTVSWGGENAPCEIGDGPRMQFLEGRWDSTLELLSAKDEISATAARLPYFNQWQ